MVDYAAPEMMQTDVRGWPEQRQSALHVTTTTITPSGQTLDWVPVESQDSEPIAEPPPAVTHDVQADQARPTRSVRFDVGEAGPAGHVPVLRPAPGRIGSLDQLRRVQWKSGGLRVNVNRANKKISDPDPAGYFHALSSQSATVYGADAWLNLWDPAVDIPSSPGDDHSISQLWLQNYQKPQLQSLEGGLTVDHNLNGDSANHLFTYYTTNGYSQDGNNLGGYNRLESGWIQYHPSIFPGIRINGTSVQGQSPQLEIGIKYQLWQGNWWFGFNNNESGPWIWLGYYPGSLFNGGIADQVDWVGWGGEVGESSRSLVCTNGCPSAATLRLLAQLTAGRTTLHVRADDDVSGQEIVAGLRASIPNARLWRYTLRRPDTPRYEEQDLDLLLHDLDRSRASQ